MNRKILTSALALVGAFTVGLGWSYYTSNSSSGGVAVVDLDEVAKRLGRDKEMVSSIQTQAGALTQQLAGIQEKANAELKQIRDGLGEQPSEDAAKQYILTQRNAQVQLNQLEQNAQVMLNQHRAQLISKFREDAKPIALKAAKDRGFSTVVAKNDTVIFEFDNSVDITEEVVQLMSAEMPAKSVAPATTPAATVSTANSATPAAAKPAQSAAGNPANQTN